jgi:hypothetical protein
MAVVLLAGETGALAWQSSGGLWAITRPWHGPVHVIGPRARRGDGFVIHRTRHLPPEDVTVHWGIPTTTPLRTLLDLSRTLSLRAQYGLPQPVSNGFVCGREVDLHWPGLGLIVEVDGYETHGPRPAFEADRIRDQDLLVAGWRVARVTDWQMTELRAETATRFAALLRPPA